MVSTGWEVGLEQSVLGGGLSLEWAVLGGLSSEWYQGDSDWSGWYGKTAWKEKQSQLKFSITTSTLKKKKKKKEKRLLEEARSKPVRSHQAPLLAACHCSLIVMSMAWGL